MQKLHKVLVEGVLDTLQSILLENRYADKALEQVFRHNRKWGARDRGFVAESVYTTIRHLRRYQYMAGLAEIRDRTSIICLFQCHRWEKYGHFAALLTDCGLDTATLEARTKELSAMPTIRESFPDWLYALIQDEYGDSAEALVTALNREAPVILRVNTLKTSRAAAQKRLLEEGVATVPLPQPDALRLERRGNIFRTQSFVDGWIEVQDSASQEVAPFVQVAPGMQVVDACAGAGGKSLHMAAFMQGKGRLLAMDVEDYKLAELKKRARRAGIANIETRLIDQTKVVKRLYGKADRLLLDVPCTGTGVLRRNPDAKWKLSPEFLSEVTALQADILHRYAAMLKPGGIMVYATCSLLKTENRVQVDGFLAGHPEFSLDAEQIFLPHLDDCDGFYMARLVKSGI